IAVGLHQATGIDPADSVKRFPKERGIPLYAEDRDAVQFTPTYGASGDIPMTAQQKAKKLTPRREAADNLTSPERLTALAEESHALARIVAKNPSTPISLLRDLSRSEDEATRKSVISNPRAPYDVLSYLELQFSESFVNNPALQSYNSLKP